MILPAVPAPNEPGSAVPQNTVEVDVRSPLVNVIAAPGAARELIATSTRPPGNGVASERTSPCTTDRSPLVNVIAAPGAARELIATSMLLPTMPPAAPAQNVPGSKV